MPINQQKPSTHILKWIQQSKSIHKEARLTNQRSINTTTHTRNKGIKKLTSTYTLRISTPHPAEYSLNLNTSREARKDHFNHFCLSRPHATYETFSYNSPDSPVRHSIQWGQANRT